jgi:hypothetical protein
MKRAKKAVKRGDFPGAESGKTVGRSKVKAKSKTRKSSRGRVLHP